MVAAIYHPYIEQGTAWEHRFYTDMDYTGLLGRAYIGRCGQIFATPTVVVSLQQNKAIVVSLTAAQAQAIPTCGKTYLDCERYDYLVELYHPTDLTRVYRMENGVARVSPRRPPLL